MSSRAHKARQWSRLIALAAVVSTAFGGASAVIAEEPASDPLWYMEKMRIPAIHEAGITGEGVTIAVLDSRINLHVPTLADADIEIREVKGCGPAELEKKSEYDYYDFEAAGHGTAVTSMIVGNGTSESGIGPQGVAPDARILYYATGSIGPLKSNCGDGQSDARAIKDAIAQGADIISISSGTPADEVVDPNTWAWVTDALQAGVLVVFALPNGNDAMEVVQEKTNGVVNVVAVDSNANVSKDEFDGVTPLAFDDVDVVAPGVNVASLGDIFADSWEMRPWTGNSFAAPIVSSVLALAMQKWPDARPEQLLQSLIRNTGSNPHELGWRERIGYGVVNATRMMEENPSQYPDVNPLFKEDQHPTFEEVYTPELVEKPESADQGTEGSTLGWVVAGAIGVIVLVLGLISAAVIIPIVIFRSRRRRRRQAVPHEPPAR